MGAAAHPRDFAPPPAAGDPPGPTYPGAKVSCQMTTLLNFCMSPCQGAPWVADPPPGTISPVPTPSLFPYWWQAPRYATKATLMAAHSPAAATTRPAAAGSWAPWGLSHPAHPRSRARTWLSLAMGSPAASLCRHPRAGVCK